LEYSLAMFRLHDGGWLKGTNPVNRRGSWNNKARNSRSANRNNNPPDNRNNNLGFREAVAQPTRWISR